MTKANGTNDVVDLPTNVKREMTKAVNTLAKAKAMDTEAKGLKESAKEVMLPLMAAYELKSYVVEGTGKALLKISSGNIINEGKLRENLMLAGMEPDQVDATISNSSKAWSKEYVEFRVK